jgi:5'(3')-deoxyribonucleotidase
MINPRFLAFDIDGVVADTMSLFVEIARRDYQIHIRYEDITRYILEDCLDMDSRIISEIIGKLLDGSRDYGLHPIPGAVEVLTRLGKDYGPLCFVTARHTVEPIRDWMINRLPLSLSELDIVATGSFDDKADVLREKGIRYFVEDRLETCFLLQEAGITPVLFKQPWNREDHPFTEVETWQELESLMDF